jgi:GntR family transcriptional regulator/MocR family aminotransferase
LLAHALDAGVWAVERPGYAGSAHVLGQLVACRPVQIDGQGLIPGEIPDAAGAVLVTPSHQYPTGSLMPAERRRGLVAACRHGGRWLVEDDYDSHLAAPGLVPAAVQALAPDTVVLVGSLSKLLAPGLRLGWIVAPPTAAHRLRELRQQTDLGVSVLTQLTAAHLIGSGALDRNLRRARMEYAQRRGRLAAALAPRWSLSGAAVGVHAFVPTSAGNRLAAAFAEARLPAVTVDDERWPGVVVSVAGYTDGNHPPRLG